MKLRRIQALIITFVILICWFFARAQVSGWPWPFTFSNNAWHTEIVNINNVENLRTFGAIPSTGYLAPVTATITAGNKTIPVSSIGMFIAGRGAVFYGEGAVTAPSTPAAPSGVAAGYKGAGGGATSAYQMITADCDANWSCSAASSASASVTAAPLLSEPNAAGASGNNITWTSTGSGVHHIWWRSSDGGTTFHLWRVTDSLTWTDWTNHSMANSGHRWNDTPLVSATGQDWITTVSSVGTTSIVVADSPPNTLTTLGTADDTVAFNNAYINANATGKEIYCQPGIYHVRAISPLGGTRLFGPVFDPNGQLGCLIYGTTGDDVFTFPSATGFSFERLTIVQGRNAFVWPTDATYSHFKETVIGPDETAFLMQSSLEEMRVERAILTGSYGLFASGSFYLQKSNWSEVTCNGEKINCIYAVVTVQAWIADKFEGLIVQNTGQDGLYLNAPGNSNHINKLSTEGNGFDWRSSLKSTTATFTNGSNVYAVASAAGLAIGQDVTIQGASQFWQPLEGTICAIAGLNITVDSDAACTTALNAGRNSPVAEPFTNSPFDDVYLNQPRATWSNSSITGLAIGDGGARWSVQSPGGGGDFMNCAANGTWGIHDGGGNSTVVNLNGTLILNQIGAGGTQPIQGRIITYQAASSGWNHATLDSPPGGDTTMGFVNKSGSYGLFRIYKDDGNRTTIFSVDPATGNINTTGSPGDFFFRSTTASSLPGTCTNGQARNCSDCGCGGGACAGGGGGCLAVCNSANAWNCP